MPAPQSALMKQIARAKFMSFGLKVPPNWQRPQGEAGQQYDDAFKPAEKNTAPGSPPLFLPASLNKYHTDAQKMLIAKIGEFIDVTCDAICAAWSQWQSAASLVGVIINAVTASGGQVVGIPWTPLILANGLKATPQQLRYTSAVATTLGTAWQAYTATIKVPGLPWYPLFAACPSPVAPPTPNVPCPVAALTQVEVSLQPALLKQQMVAALGDPGAPYHGELFEAIIEGFSKSFLTWKTSTMVTNVLGAGPVPTFAPPLVPAGPVVGGFGNMAPGGFA